MISLILLMIVLHTSGTVVIPWWLWVITTIQYCIKVWDGFAKLKERSGDNG